MQNQVTLTISSRGKRVAITGIVNGVGIRSIERRIPDFAEDIVDLLVTDKIGQVDLAYPATKEVLAGLKEVKAAHDKVQQVLTEREETISKVGPQLAKVGFSQDDIAAMIGIKTSAYRSIISPKDEETRWGAYLLGQDTAQVGEDGTFLLGSWALNDSGDGVEEKMPCVVHGMSARIESAFYSMTGFEPSTAKNSNQDEQNEESLEGVETDQHSEDSVEVPVDNNEAVAPTDSQDNYF